MFVDFLVFWIFEIFFGVWVLPFRFCISGILVILVFRYSFLYFWHFGHEAYLGICVSAGRARARAQRLEGSSRSRQRPQPAPPPGRSGRPRDRLRELSGTLGRLREGRERSGSLRDELRGSCRSLGDAPGESGRLRDGLYARAGDGQMQARLRAWVLACVPVCFIRGGARHRCAAAAAS